MFSDNLQGEIHNVAMCCTHTVNAIIFRVTNEIRGGSNFSHSMFVNFAFL